MTEASDQPGVTGTATDWAELPAGRVEAETAQWLRDAEEECNVILARAQRQASRIRLEARKLHLAMEADCARMGREAARSASQREDAAREEAARILAEAQRRAGTLLEEAHGEAAGVIETAHSEAARLAEAAHSEAARITEEARREAGRITEAARADAARVTEAAAADAAEVGRSARSRADEIVAAADREAAGVRSATSAGAEGFGSDVDVLLGGLSDLARDSDDLKGALEALRRALHGSGAEGQEGSAEGAGPGARGPAVAVVGWTAESWRPGEGEQAQARVGSGGPGPVLSAEARPGAAAGGDQEASPAQWEDLIEAARRDRMHVPGEE